MTNDVASMWVEPVVISASECYAVGILWHSLTHYSRGLPVLHSKKKKKRNNWFVFITVLKFLCSLLKCPAYKCNIKKKNKQALNKVILLVLQDRRAPLTLQSQPVHILVHITSSVITVVFYSANFKLYTSF